MEGVGLDGFVVTANISLGVGSNHPLATADASVRVVNCRSGSPR
jgi:hypothetical protein